MSTVKTILAGVMLAATLTGPATPAPPAPLPACAFEDGNPDGTACLWTDPDTGRQFFVNSENYR